MAMWFRYKSLGKLIDYEAFVGSEVGLPEDTLLKIETALANQPEEINHAFAILGRQPKVKRDSWTFTGDEARFLAFNWYCGG